MYQRKKSSGFSAAKAVVDHMKDWISGTEDGNWVSMAVLSDGSYGIPEGIIFSFPVTCNGFDYQIVKDIVLTDFSKEMIQMGVDELQDEKEEAQEDL